MALLCVGHAVQDFVFSLPQMPDQAIKYTASQFTSVGGGPAATAAVTIAKLGGNVSLAARVGSDSAAELIVKELSGYGVNCEWVKAFDGVCSSVSSVMIDANGERLIVNYIDPALPTDPAWLPDALDANIKAVLADTRWPQGAKRMLAMAKQTGIPAILDADKPMPKDEALLQAASHLTFSADGLSDYIGHDDHENALTQLAEQTGAWCCVTLGEKGVFFAEGRARGKDKSKGYVPGFSVTAVDTLGAGDVWHGAFAHAIAEGQHELDAAHYANAAAAVKVQRHGGRNGAPSSEEIQQFLADFG